jgi:transglutaminase-like putative cysteine protease
MLFDITHITQYNYDEPVRESVMELWMQPRAAHGQNLLNFNLDIEPLAQVFSYVDSWGNTVRHFDVPHPHTRLTITTHSLVETDARPALPGALNMAEWERLANDFVQDECWEFLRPHGFAAWSPKLRAFCDAHGVDELRRLDPLTALDRLSTVLYQGLDYEKGVTGPDSPIDEALEGGRGVCQDFAHIMITIARDWGIPARYVSGYLAASRDHGERSDPQATHAWVEVFLPSLRWVGFDPANDILACDRHIPVAIGRDYSDVPPSRGVFKGDAESQLSVGVSVRNAAAEAGEPEFLRLGAPAVAAARRRASSAARQDLHQQHQQQQQQ